MIEIELFHSHFYRGARGRILPDWHDDDALVAFSDGSRAKALLLGETLYVSPYRTAAGTQIAAKTWDIRATRLGFRVVARRSPG